MDKGNVSSSLWDGLNTIQADCEASLNCIRLLAKESLNTGNVSSELWISLNTNRAAYEARRVLDRGAPEAFGVTAPLLVKSAIILRCACETCQSME